MLGNTDSRNPSIRFNKRNNLRLGRGLRNENNILISNDVLFVPTSSGAFNFITCFSFPGYSLYAYTYPFDCLSWILIMFCLMFLSLFVYVISDPKIKSSNNSIDWLIFYAVLLENSFQVNRNLEKQLWFRICLFTWLTMSIVLSNGYVGVGISSVTSPVSLTSISSFEETIPSCPHYDPKCGDKSDKFTLLSEPADTGFYIPSMITNSTSQVLFLKFGVLFLHLGILIKNIPLSKLHDMTS